MSNDNTVVLEDGEVALRVQGIEEWITTLVPMSESYSARSGIPMIRLIDPKTGAIFLMRREK